MTRPAPMPARPVRLAALVLAAAAAAAPARADQPLWELGLGAGVLSLPHYRGSDQDHRWLLPVPYAVYRGRIFRATREGARAVLLESDRFDFDLSVAASPPVRSNDNRARSGMPDLDPTLEFGPNLNFTLARGSNWKLDLRLPVRAVFTFGSGVHSIGTTVSPVLNLDLQRQGWNVGVQAGPLFASRAYHGYFYGVDAAYAAPGRPAYRAPGGAAGWRFTTGVSRRFDSVWVGAYVRADTVAGAAFEASPLVRRKENLSFGLALSWVFATADERVPDDR